MGRALRQTHHLRKLQLMGIALGRPKAEPGGSTHPAPYELPKTLDLPQYSPAREAHGSSSITVALSEDF
jgi:hypothetical protein